MNIRTNTLRQNTMYIDVTLAKIIHIICAVFFVGFLLFIAFVLDHLKHTQRYKEHKVLFDAISKRARQVMLFILPFLFVSGLYLVWNVYLVSFLPLSLLIKISLAMIVFIIFYNAEWIIKKIHHRHYLHHFFHFFVLLLMFSILILSQLSF